MDYAEKFFTKIKDGTLETADIIEFLDKWLADEAGRKEREEQQRQENPTCENCKHCIHDCGELICNYWDDVITEPDQEYKLCGYWR